MKYKKVTLIILIWATFSAINGQNIDSLRQILSIQKPDTNRVNILRMLSGLLKNSDPNQAIAFGKEGVTLGKSLNFDKGTAGCLLNVSVNFTSLDQLDSSLVYINEALLYADKVGEPNRLALAYLNRADIYMQKKEFQKSLADCDIALKYADEADNNDRRARILQTIGSVYFYQQNYAKALEYYQKALKFYEQLGNLQMSALVYNNCGNIYKQIGQFDKAETNFFDAIKIGEELGDLVNLGMYHYNLSDVYLESGDLKKAEKSASLSMKYGVDQGIPNQISAAGEALASVYLSQGHYAKAITFGEKSLNLAKENEDLNIMVNVSYILSQAYEKSGRPNDALQILKYYHTVSDSILRLQFNEDISEIQTKFDVDSKDREIKILEQDKTIREEKLSRQRLLFGLLILLTLSAFLGFMFYIYIACD